MPETRLVTAEEFYAMPDDRPRELVGGEIVEMSHPGARHGRILHRICGFMEAADVDSAGLFPMTNSGFLLERGPDTLRVPDLSLVRTARLEGLDIRRWLPLAPDLALEVVSPNDSFAQVEEKARMWLGCGTDTVWVVEPASRRVFVYRRGVLREEFSGNDVLTGGELFPAFAVAVDRIFEGVPQ